MGKLQLAFVLIIVAAIGTALYVWSQAAEMMVDAGVPSVTDVKAFPDDQIASITWKAPANSAQNNIVGYYVRWGIKGSGQISGKRQVTNNVTQIQPLENGKEYEVYVHAIQGNMVTVNTTNIDFPVAQEARANGKVSPAVVVTVMPNGARVAALRQEMTGFFDDFNQPAGAFDELKWNNATSACVEPGEAGAFINAQFHAHNMIKSTCDRAQVVSRPRAIFDITGRTEANPGIVVMDLDGIHRPRDVWYLDFIPTTARRDGTALDVPGHADAFDEERSDPAMLRITQNSDVLQVRYYDETKTPRVIQPTFTCPSGAGQGADLRWCDASTARKQAGLTPLPQAPTYDNLVCAADFACLKSIPNYRRHWRVHVSPTKISIFIDSVKVWEGPMPTTFRNTTKYVLHSNQFSYNTGKDDSIAPTTSMYHWDNFGFNGPASTTITHNYIEGGPSGVTPYFGRGSVANAVPQSATRSTKIPIPDEIRTPQKALLKFTLQPFGYSMYHWRSSDHILVNGQRYAMPDPAAQMQAPMVSSWDGNPKVAEIYTPFSTSIALNPAHLRTGTNDITFGLGTGDGIINVHIELEYNKGSQPNYTQPKDVFTPTVYNSFFMPALRPHDSYIFIEQNMQLTSGDTAHNHTPAPNPTPQPVTGDVNGNGTVDAADLAALLANYRKPGTFTRGQGDLNGDAKVDAFDLSILLSNWSR